MSQHWKCDYCKKPVTEVIYQITVKPADDHGVTTMYVLDFHYVCLQAWAIQQEAAERGQAEAMSIVQT